MALQQQTYSIDDVWRLAHQTSDDDKRFELIDGELFEMSPPGALHGYLAIRLGRFLDVFVEEHQLGIVTVETGHHPPGDRMTLLAPDIAFTSRERAPQPLPKRYMPLMPDLAVEIVSPGDVIKQLYEKAALYLRHGTRRVWIVRPAKKGVEVCRAEQDGGMTREWIGQDSILSGEPVLPGFRLALRRLFA